MRVSPIIIAVLTLSSSLVSFIILTQPLGRCDPYFPPLTRVDIEGAHIVSEGAYFRFWIFNNNSFSITVTVNGADILSVPPKSWIDYDVIAPHIFVPYEQVTYKFSLTSSSYPAKTVDFTVLVLNSSFVQIFDLLVPILITITIAAIVVALVAIVFVKRRRGHKKTDTLSLGLGVNFTPTNQIKDGLTTDDHDDNHEPQRPRRTTGKGQP